MKKFLFKNEIKSVLLEILFNIFFIIIVIIFTFLSIWTAAYVFVIFVILIRKSNKVLIINENKLIILKKINLNSIVEINCSMTKLRFVTFTEINIVYYNESGKKEDAQLISYKMFGYECILKLLDFFDSKGISIDINSFKLIGIEKNINKYALFN